jgi:hypothetical protein
MITIKDWLSQHEVFINQAWFITLSATLVLYILCNVLPDRITGQFLPLHNVFKPETNVDLDYQSIGYALLHTTWATHITHSTIIIEAVLWFVIFDNWHWSVPFIALLLMLIQSVFIGDKKFGVFFILMGILTFAAAIYTTQFLGAPNAVLLSKTVLMMGGLMRMLSHSAELIPPLLVNQTDQFEKLTAKNINWKVLLSSPIGYIGEFGSSLPNRILPVQVNYIYQTVFGVKPETTLSWNAVEASAKEALTGGYSKLNSLRNYYDSVVKGG